MFYQWEGQDLILNLYLAPNAKQDEIVGPFEGALKIKITAPAVENKANRYIINLLSQWFKVPKSHILLLKGQQSRTKQFRIREPKQVPSWIS